MESEEQQREREELWDVPGLGLGDGDDHTLEVMVEDDLAAEAGVLVEDACAIAALQHVFLVVGARRELIEPFLGDADLALGRAGVDILQAVGGRLDHPAVGQGLQQGLPRQPHHLALLALRVHREQLHDAI